MFEVRVQQADFSLEVEVEALRQQAKGAGALVAFVGLVREMHEDSQVRQLFLEHYPQMTENSLRQIVVDASDRWPLLGVTVLHRVGALAPADQIVLVAVATAHRQEAFAAAEFIMDFLKTAAPFWKKEFTATGERWIDSRCDDHQAVARWQRQPIA